MRYVSTRRGGNTTVTPDEHAGGAGDGGLCGVSFEEALTRGYAPDHGLYVPSSLPEIDRPTLEHFATLSYRELMYQVLRRFICADEIPDDDLEDICASSFRAWGDIDEFGPEGGSRKDIVPVTKVGSVYVAELFHGPTHCFKDLGLGVVVNLLSYFATRRRRSTTLLVATTGDTGPAAFAAVCEVDNPLLGILVHYPLGQISEFQRRQLTTVEARNARVVAFEGGGDDMDGPIKRILTTTGKAGDGNDSGGASNELDEVQSYRQRLLCGINSYNIGRPIAQMTHFIWTYLRVIEQLGGAVGDPDVKVDIVVPTGAMGNIVGGYMAKCAGVPLGRLCAAVNANDITHRAFSTGKFHKSGDAMVRTLSEAINIQVPYNFERLLYYLTGGNPTLVRGWMISMEATDKLDLDETLLIKLQSQFGSARISDDEMCNTMRTIWERYGYMVDPHTAVAVAAADLLGYGPLSPPTCSKATPVAIMATASPCKFQESVTVALGEAGWQRYYETEFPDRARITMTKKEVPPTVYRRKKGLSFKEVQRDWEQRSRDIIHSMQP